MECLKNIQICTDKPVYYPGETINGQVVFEAAENISVKSVRIRLVGDCKIHWSRSRSFKRCQKRVEDKFTAVENYIGDEALLIPQNTSGNIFLEKGIYEYPFEFILPLSLPSSFEHPLGRIRYKICLMFDPQVKIVEKPFTIINIIDLNENSMLRKPSSTAMKNSRDSCFCFNRGSLTLTLDLLHGAFVPGQGIEFGIIIENKSRRTYKNIAVQLLQQTYIQSNSHVRLVSSFEYPRVIYKYTDDFMAHCFLNIPPVCPTLNQSLIKVNYLVFVNLNSSRRRIKLRRNSMIVPIFIGTRPFEEEESFFQPLYGCEPCIFGRNFEAQPQRVFYDESDRYYDYRPFYIYMKPRNHINL